MLPILRKRQEWKKSNVMELAGIFIFRFFLIKENSMFNVILGGGGWKKSVFLVMN